MRTASYRVCDLQNATIPLGFAGENLHRRIVFKAEEVYSEYPHAAASLTVRPPYGEPYPAVVARDGNDVLWDVEDSDLVRSGMGELQLAFTEGDVVCRTYVGKTRIGRSIMPTGEIPDPMDDFLTRAGAALTAIPETIDAAFDAITAEAETLEAGKSATASFDSETKVLTIGVPAGADGDPGQPGADGYSPTITVTDITGGHRLTITDKNGTRTVDVMDGEDGQPGQDGDPGAPGFSPVITVTDITGGHRLTITTATGTQTVDVMDGSGGDPTTLIDDTAGAGVVNKTWSANKLNTETSALLSAISGKLDSPQTAGTQGQVLTSDGQGGQSWETPSGGGGVSDVQVNGTSVVSQGVANIPVIANDSYGIPKVVNHNYGLQIRTGGELAISPPNGLQIKNLDVTTRVVSPKDIPACVFFGLANVAGDTTQKNQLSNVAGTYTESAKSAISDMLNAPETVSGSTPSITAKSGVRYICGECSTLTVVVPATGIIDVVFESGSTATVLTVTPPTGMTMKWPDWFDPTSLDASKTYEINIMDGCYGAVSVWA